MERADYRQEFVAASYRSNSDWWDRAKLPPRPQPIEIRKRELLVTLRKGEHPVTLEKRPVRGVGDELIFSVNGHWRRMRVFKEHGPLLSGSVSATMTNLKSRGWKT